ncbi:MULTISPECIES: Na+/H+ antiporter [Gordonia]|jgi:CPA1 family monovalent cation:H+ antiporter|uniref:Sodium/hydrogen exchanger n=2 Tax=Gordonia alkanivorans TaxID=84096 RepID=W9DKE4_9ACTN|nr:MULTISPECIES: Na+/H+ antiporter [Gordonia]ETA07135.1 sodium/hydrogen exchanger [Gordonia alkanivorans CGMCC 6845]MDH3008342.1 Na+/H+ antiporter [Gordonia alkanivorans]MDH3012389.1 Na+/H+ antiporter [Gordonia alkanivorans]MDH3017268.1 Na+/H+ antiporter [Gordonia alkanivorans]MDH3021815.1 Na+/H+ antiporter [Gordonia alkanivorans]
MSASLLVIAVVALAVAALCRRHGLSSPLILVTVGLAIGWIPGLPTPELNPELVLFLILPPLLYSAAQESSYQAIRARWRGIAALAVGLPLVTTVVVGFVAHLTVPNLPLSAALVLGAVVAPPDAVSAQAIGRRLGLPRPVMTLLGGESLLNDATALTAFRIALAAAIGLTASLSEGLLTFAVAAVGGLVVGLLFGVAVSWVRIWLTDPPMETAIGIMVPFATYFVAEQLHCSGVIGVVTAGLFLGQRSVRLGYATRLQDEAVRKSIDVILESFVFLLIGVQMPFIIEGVEGESWVQVAIDAAAVLTATIVIRFLWVYPAAYLPGVIFRGRLGPDPRPTPASVFVVSWAGMRGVVSLAAAFGIPLTTQSGEPFPARAEILLLTFVVVVGTLLIQGTTLPWVIRKLGVTGDERAQDRLAYAAAQDRASREAEHRLEEIAAGLADDDPRRMQVVLMRKWITSQRDVAWEELGRGPETIGESPTAAGSRIRTELLHLQRKVFIAERDAGRIDDEVLRIALRRLDFAEGQGDRGV